MVLTLLFNALLVDLSLSGKWRAGNSHQFCAAAAIVCPLIHNKVDICIAAIPNFKILNRLIGLEWSAVMTRHFLWTNRDEEISVR
jgi:hypothetical protein